ncbi:hypothetical protein SAMN05421766_104745 [Zobellia uliginosa]|uniref:Lipoprotein-releasing system permease protein n=1 Tax=Zobellia uliginosa TaxID=143224 RepID=A0ABY1KYC2_9FLAO|nr:hypothetical protein SAMN05421766_104745 [Zobellia uliginosa]
MKANLLYILSNKGAAIRLIGVLTSVIIGIVLAVMSIWG